MRGGVLFLTWRLGSQGLGFISGLFILRSLSLKEFATYAIALTILGSVGAISESGISSTLLSRLSTYNAPQDGIKVEFGSASTARFRVGAVVVVTGSVVLTIVLTLAGTPIIQLVLVVIVTAVACSVALSTSLLSVCLQAAGCVQVLRWSDLGAAVARLGLIVVILQFSVQSPFMFLFVNLAVSLGQRGYESLHVRRLIRSVSFSVNYAPQRAQPYRGAVKASLPTAILMIAGEQAIPLVLSGAGNAVAVGNIAAYGKFAALFSATNAFFSIIIASRVARADILSRSGRQLLALTLGAQLLFSGAYVATGVVAAPLLLNILGLPVGVNTDAFYISTIGIAVVNFAVSGVGAVCHGRGWVAGAWTFAPCVLVWLAINLLFTPLTSLYGASIFAASLSVPILISYLARMVLGLRWLQRRVVD